MDIYLIIKDILTFLITIAGLIIAGMGLATWKKQIHGSKQFEIAYNLHFSILNLRDAIKYVRNPAIFPNESQRAIQYSKSKHPERPPEEIEGKPISYVYETRWEKIIDALAKLESHLLGAEVLWGGEIVDLIKPLYKKINELKIALDQYLNPDLRGSREYDEIHDIVYDQGNYFENKEDVFSKQTSDIIENIANYLKGKI